MRALHRCTMLLAALGLIAIISGAYVTSTQVAAKQAQAEVSVAGEGFHRGASIALTIAALGVAAFSSFLKNRTQWLFWCAFAALAVSVVLGWRGALSPGIAVVHALMAHLFFAAIIVAKTITSDAWNRAIEVATVTDWPWLRPVAIATPPAVLVQITLGTAYRHDLTGVMPHMAGAMIVALMTVVTSAVILQNFPAPVSLRRAASALISVVLMQVVLGIAAFVMLVLNVAGTLGFVIATVGHVLVGAGTFAGSFILAMQVWRSIPRKTIS